MDTASGEKAADRASAAADKKSADLKAAEKTAAVEGATSVAEAVRRVADAAVAEVQKTQAGPAYDLQFSGSPGGTFTITGPGLGSSGTVKVGGRQVETTAWSTQRIEGLLPADVPDGEVTVQLDEKTVRRGVFKRT